MTIQEAIRSGLRFRRAFWSNTFIEPDSTGTRRFSLTAEDILATDWEVDRHDASTEKLVEQIVRHRRELVAHIDEVLEKLGYKK